MPTQSTNNNKRIVKNTLLLYLRSVLLILISLYTSRVILDALGVKDYGIYNIVGGVVTSVSILVTALASATQRFITFALGKGDENHLKEVFQTSVTIHIVLGIIAVVFLESVGLFLLYNHLNIPSERLSAAALTMHCSIIVLFINFIAIPYNSLIIAHERMGAFAYISLLDASFKLLIAYLLSVSTMDRLVLYAFLLMMVAFVQRLLYMVYCKRHFEESVHLQYKLNKSLFKEMFTFSAWNLLGNGSAVLRNQGIDVLMNMFFGVTVNAAKGVCNQVQGAVYQFVSNFQTAINPQLTKSISGNDYQRANQLIITGSRYSFYLLSMFSIPMMLFTKEILSLWLVETPEYTVEFIRWTFVYLHFDCTSRLMINSILATGHIKKYQIVVSGIKFLALPLAYLFFIFWKNPVGGIVVNVLLEFICLLLRLYFNNKQVGLKYSSFLFQAIVKTWIVFLVSVLLSWIICQYINSVLVVNLILSAIIPVSVIYSIGISKRERLLVKQKINRIVNERFRHV